MTNEDLPCWVNEINIITDIGGLSCYSENISEITTMDHLNSNQSDLVTQKW